MLWSVALAVDKANAREGRERLACFRRCFASEPIHDPIPLNRAYLSACDQSLNRFTDLVICLICLYMQLLNDFITQF